MSCFRELRQQLAGMFLAAGVETPAVDAERLIAETAGFPRAELFLRGEEPVPEPLERSILRLAERRAAREPLQYLTGRAAFMDLEQGAVDAVAIDIGVAQYQIAQREAGKFVMLQGEDNKLAVEQYAVGFLKGNDELRDTVQKTLDEMAADGTFTQIAEKWGLTDSVCLGK